VGQILVPGSRVEVTVLKRLENGLIVKFMGVFIGYIFEDYVEDSMKKGSKF